MKTAIVAFILSMLCGTILTPLVRRLAHRFGALDHARSSRKIHGKPIPRLGGIAIVVAFYTPLVGLLIFQTGVGHLFLAEREHVIGLFVGGLAIAALGLYDDLRGANAWKKFVVQFAVAGLLYRLGFRIDAIANPLGEPIALGWASLPFTMFWFVGVINALNLIDGLDGLAGGVALVAVITTFLVALQRAHPLMMLFSSALAGAIIGFLFYNFNPASIFMGDTGSMFLGFALAATAIQTNQKSSTVVAVLIPAIALGLPIMDTLLAIGRRALRGRPLFQADREHIHHRLMAAGLSHRQAVLVLYFLCVLLGAAALILTYANSGQSTLLLIVLALVALVFLRSLGYMRLDRVSATALDRKRNRALRGALRPLGRRLRQARATEEMWPIVVEAAGIVEACRVRLRSEGPSVAGPGTFSQGFDGNGELDDTVPFVVPSGKGIEHVLELAWPDGRREVDRDTEIAIDIFCEHLGDALELLNSPGVNGRGAAPLSPRQRGSR
jgi:UDP-GlcNAc:undecaprenyl-phosphate/decaprenyl-phosphate GlcNAc-1-phosphate transferase